MEEGQHGGGSTATLHRVKGLILSMGYCLCEILLVSM